MRFAPGLIALLAAATAAWGQSLEEARTLHRRGELRQALSAYRAVAERVAATSPEEAAIARNNACVVLTDLGDFTEAVEECRQALELRRRSGDDRRAARTLNNLGLALQHLGRLDEAERSFAEALAINRALQAVESVAINLANLGVVATLRGHFDEALRLHGRVVELAAGHPDTDWAREQTLTARINRGVVLEKVGAFDEALAIYRDLLASSEALDPRRRATLLVNVGVIYRNLGDPMTALESFDEAAAIFRRLEDPAALSNVWLNVALARHLNLDRLTEAEEAYREALRLAEKTGDRPELIQDLFYLGRLLVEQGRLEAAGEIFQRCLRAAEASDSAEGLWSAWEGLGRVAHLSGRHLEALVYLEQALAMIETIRSGLGESAYRAGYFGDKRAAYAVSVEVLRELHRLRPGEGFDLKALEIAQRAKARDLIDALGPAGRPAPPLTATELQRLAGDAPILEIYVADPHLQMWLIEGDRIRMFDPGLAAPLLETVGRVHQELADGRRPAQEDLDTLSAALMRPLDGFLGGVERLRISPDGRLHYLPFELLSAPSDRDRTVLDLYEVSYLPSASILGRLGPDPDEEAPSLLGFADPSLPLDSADQPVALASLARRFDLRPLPASARELEAVARSLPGRRLLHRGTEATESAFRRAASGGARIVHLAAHTVVDERSAGGVAILLAPAEGEDGLLSPGEIGGLEIPARLTVLAGCRTALGSSRDGRALASLTGAFLASGSRAVVATLWDVGDLSAEAFMEQFYYSLGRGLPPGAAMRQAKLRLRSDPGWSLPHRWSGFVVVGEASAAAVEQRNRSPLWLALAAGLALAGILLARRRRRDSGVSAAPAR